MLTRKTAVVAVAAGAAALVVAIPSAFAAGTTYNVSAGKKTSGTVAYMGKTSAITFKDGKTTLTCKSGTASGSIKLGKGRPGSGLASITKSTWVGCTGPGGIALTVKQSGTWKLNGTSKVSKAGVTQGNIGSVKANVSGGGGSCSFTVTGAVNGNYANKTGNLTVKSSKGNQLTVAKGASCLGVVNAGDHPTFSAVYKITTKSGALKLANG